MNKKIKLAIIILVTFALGFAFGFYAGTEIVIRKIVSIGQKFIDIDYQLVNAAIWMYESQFDIFENASIYVDERNREPNARFYQ